MKDVLLAIYANHKKKVLAVAAAIILYIVAAVSGLSVGEIKDAVHDAPVIELPATAPVVE